MADVLLATLLLLGGFAWAFICILAGANHPTGEMPWGPFFVGFAASLAGLLWWVGIIAGWLM